MRDESLQFLERLVNTPSPSGREARGQRVWLDYVKGFADETFSDAYGNAVAVLNKGGSPRLMLAAHADEPVSGVVGNVAPHLSRSEPDRKLPKMEDLFIDIGVNSRKDAEKLIRIG